jgi:DNA-binding CsgD family transcriptional regulator
LGPNYPEAVRGNAKSAREEHRLLKRFSKMEDDKRLSSFDANTIIWEPIECADKVAEGEIDPEELLDSVSLSGLPDHGFEGWSARVRPERRRRGRDGALDPGGGQGRSNLQPGYRNPGARLLRGLSPGEAPPQAFPTLTDREREILHLIAQGHPNPSIARQLSLSTKTVGNYVSNIFTKLQVADRAQAIIRAREAGLG